MPRCCRHETVQTSQLVIRRRHAMQRHQYVESEGAANRAAPSSFPPARLLRPCVEREVPKHLRDDLIHGIGPELGELISNASAGGASRRGVFDGECRQRGLFSAAVSYQDR